MTGLLNNLLSVVVGGSQTIDQSGTYTGVNLPVGASLSVTQDSSTPSGDPVAVTLSGLALGLGSTLTVANGATMTMGGLASAVVGSTVNVGNNATLDLAAGVGSLLASTVNFAGSGGTLQVDGTNLSLLSPITGFTSGDCIDLRNIGSITGLHMSNGILTLLNNGVSVGAIALSGNFDPTKLGIQSDGFGGLKIGIGLGGGVSSAGNTTSGGSGGSGTVTTGATVTAAATASVTGSHGEYLIAEMPSGSFNVQATLSGQTSTSTVANNTVMQFLDGTGYLNSTGHAEDVAHLYQAAFGRAPDLSGLQYWAGQLDAGTATTTDVATAFAGSAEFANKYGNLSNSDYVSQLYQNVLGRAADASGQSYWTGQMAQGCSRGQVLLGLAKSYENISNTLGTTGDSTYGEAYRLYQAALGRAPDASGLSYWTSAMLGGMTAAQVAAGFTAAPEFTGQYSGLGNTGFIDKLYQNVLGRAADASGESYWTAQINAGASRAQVLVGFSDSQENRLGTAAATHDGWVFMAS